ncbi:hypothetical protein PMIN01_04161 [Paraphaeosphaeria minitans]|uniref:Uncharacterized protein n=1 Tax=Paraphaeosphaeria minitans TaxID=565426 RepID=A0A9P6KTH9_9PLEO|nr:hypothetical protein PMIN01_04161 [Paraphaeosphaeria minitans]
MTWATLMSSAASYDAAACVNLTDVAGTSREARPQAPQAQLLCQSSARIASLESSIRPDATAIPSTLDHNTTKERRLPKPISFRDPGDLTEYVFVDHEEKGNMISDESGDPLKPKHVPRETARRNPRVCYTATTAGPWRGAADDADIDLSPIALPVIEPLIPPTPGPYWRSSLLNKRDRCTASSTATPGSSAENSTNRLRLQRRRSDFPEGRDLAGPASTKNIAPRGADRLLYAGSWADNRQTRTHGWLCLHLARNADPRDVRPEPGAALQTTVLSMDTGETISHICPNYVPHTTSERIRTANPAKTINERYVESERGVCGNQAQPGVKNGLVLPRATDAVGHNLVLYQALSHAWHSVEILDRAASPFKDPVLWSSALSSKDPTSWPAKIRKQAASTVYEPMWAMMFSSSQLVFLQDNDEPGMGCSRCSRRVACLQCAQISNRRFQSFSSCVLEQAVLTRLHTSWYRVLYTQVDKNVYVYMATSVVAIRKRRVCRAGKAGCDEFCPGGEPARLRFKSVSHITAIWFIEISEVPLNSDGRSLALYARRGGGVLQAGPLHLLHEGSTARKPAIAVAKKAAPKARKALLLLLRVGGCPVCLVCVLGSKERVAADTRLHGLPSSHRCWHQALENQKARYESKMARQELRRHVCRVPVGVAES